jgi:hypothetical protein
VKIKVKSMLMAQAVGTVQTKAKGDYFEGDCPKLVVDEKTAAVPEIMDTGVTKQSN